MLKSTLTSRCSARTSSAWLRYFRDHAAPITDLPSPRMVRLSEEERRAVLPSIAIFQLGESGQGRHLFHAAEAWAEASGDHEYVAALRLFIDEEHRHAAVLGRYLDLAGYPRLTKNWTDRIFRGVRHLAGLELSITVLLTAELIAMVYYAALRRATSCPLLAAISRQVLEDECAHIRFQSQQVGRLRRRHLRWVRKSGEAFHAALLAGTSLVVWHTHRPVFQAAGLSLRQFQHKLWGQYRAALSIIRSMQLDADPAAPLRRLCPA
jgi:hypothetical protein